MIMLYLLLEVHTKCRISATMSLRNTIDLVENICKNVLYKPFPKQALVFTCLH